jgi:hypothetical protein
MLLPLVLALLQELLGSFPRDFLGVAKTAEYKDCNT